MLPIILKILTLRFTKEDLHQLDKRYFYVGLLGTWLVGMGRYWDNPKAELLQHLGVGSVIYIFVLAAFIWLIIAPLKLKKWSYLPILAFISLTSFPAILYAIPVERFMDMKIAQSINAWFLAIVAAWRVALLIRFLYLYDDLDWWEIIVCTFLPLFLIINLLALLNLEHVVFNIMAGNVDPSANDGAYGLVLLITMVAWIGVLPLLAGYISTVYHRRKNKD